MGKKQGRPKQSSEPITLSQNQETASLGAEHPIIKRKQRGQVLAVKKVCGGGCREGKMTSSPNQLCVILVQPW